MKWQPLHKVRAISTKFISGLILMGSLAGVALSIQAAPSQPVAIRVHIKMTPNAVTGFAAAPVGSQNGDIQLAWVAPANANQIPINHYIVRYATYPAINAGMAESWWAECAATQLLITPAHAPGVQEFTTLPNFSIGITYYFGIKSIDEDGMISPIDNRAGLGNQAQSKPLYIAVAVPPTPLNFYGTAVSSNSIQWNWEFVATAGYYTLNNYPSGNLAAQTSSTFTIESGLNVNASVSRTIRAGNAIGLSNPSGAQTVFTLANPPTALVITHLGFTNISLSWSANGNPTGTQYRLERSNDGSSFVPVTTISTNIYQDTGLTELTSYYYRVRAQNGDGLATGYSNAVNAFTPLQVDFIAPQEPMGLNGVVDPTGRAFTLIWEPVEQNADGTVTNDLAGYNVYRKTTLTGAGTKLNPNPLPSTAYADRVDGKTFYYTVRAIDQSGNESADSLIADSSINANVIFLSTDQVTSVIMPNDVNELLRSNNNKYRTPLTVTLTEHLIPANTNIVRNITLNLVRGDTHQRVTDLAFAIPNSVVAVGYSVVNGQVAPGAPLAANMAPAAIPNARPQDLSFYWNNGVTWVKVGGTLDSALQAIKIKTSFLGDYQLRLAAASTALTLEKGNVYPRVFTPNGDGHNDRVYFVLENPNSASVSGEIYDLEGRLVKNLPAPSDSMGIGTTFVWDGTDNNNAVVPSGAYVYRIKGEGKTFSGTVAVAR